MTKRSIRVGVATTATLTLLLAASALWAPYLYAELAHWLEPHTIIDPATPTLAAGDMFDDYWAVQTIGPTTQAIGEPRYYQANYSYLLVGALLFDAGSGTRDISGVVHRLTAFPVTVLASHLHYDHTGGIGPFDSIAELDLPGTRAAVTAGKLTPGRYDYLGMIDRLAPPSYVVSEWLMPDATIDLGGRVLQVLHVPGHTPTSVALYDPASHQLFAGDFIYPTSLYAFLPGASRTQYRATTQRLLAMLPADTIIWTAHCCRAGEKPAAPWLTIQDLRDLDTALASVKAGTSTSTEFFPRRFPVNGQMTLLTGFPWNNR